MTAESRISADSILGRVLIGAQWTVGIFMIIFSRMKARIRELLHLVPFRPFVIRMADGREYRIDHPNFVLAAANDVPQITIEERDGRQHYLSALLVTSIELVPGATANAA